MSDRDTALGFDGLPLRPGDTAYTVNHVHGIEWPAGTECKVVGIRDSRTVYVAAMGLEEKMLHAASLTHEDPESARKAGRTGCGETMLWFAAGFAIGLAIKVPGGAGLGEAVPIALIAAAVGAAIVAKLRF